MKKFTVINESFTCKNCKTFNPKAKTSCRNHCLNCLYSMHLDKTNPGDRQSKCFGLMKPINLSKNSKKGWIIHHKCEKCGKEILNKSAEDDNFEEIINLSKKH